MIGLFGKILSNSVFSGKNDEILSVLGNDLQIY
jgi:hypothetical protein